MKRTRGYIEQAHRWLCHPAVIPISAAISGEIREYLCFLSDILGSVNIGVRNQSAVIADVQPTLNALAVGFRPTDRAGLRGVAFGFANAVDLDEDLHREFSKAVIDVDATKAEIVRRLIQEWTEEHTE